MHVVHVEDDRLLSDILRRSLQFAKYPISLEQFEDGDVALPYIERNLQSIDLFILDICLPGSMTGAHIAEKLRDLGYDGHIILTSAFGSPDPNWLKAFKLEYMPKPWYIRELTEKLPSYDRHLPGAPEHHETPAQPPKATPRVAAGTGQLRFPREEPADIVIEVDEDATVPHAPWPSR